MLLNIANMEIIFVFYQREREREVPLQNEKKIFPQKILNIRNYKSISNYKIINIFLIYVDLIFN